jgi:hypothetical protein
VSWSSWTHARRIETRDTDIPPHPTAQRHVDQVLDHCCLSTTRLSEDHESRTSPHTRVRSRRGWDRAIRSEIPTREDPQPLEGKMERDEIGLVRRCRCVLRCWERGDYNAESEWSGDENMAVGLPSIRAEVGA